MRRFLLLALVIAIAIGFGLLQHSTNIAQAETYRLPVNGRWDITRTDCGTAATDPNYHSGVGRFMDLNIDSYETDLTVNSNLGGAVDFGAPIYSSSNGTVTRAGYDFTGYGNLIEVTGSEVVFRYAHLAKMLVSEGQQIYAGMLIGYVGDTGKNMTGQYHLHWEGYAKPGYTFDLYNYFSSQLHLDADAPAYKGAPCVYGDPDGDDGYINGPSLTIFQNCQDAINQNYGGVLLSDATDCRGNSFGLSIDGQVNLLSGSIFQNVRSIHIYNVISPVSVLVGPNSLDMNSLNYCITGSVSNLDLLHYFNWSGQETTTAIGWNKLYPYTHNMISWAQAFNSANCNGNGNNIVGSTTLVSSIGIGPGTGGNNAQYGNSKVDIREDPYCQNGQYGWDNPTNGIFNLSPDINYMEDKTSCIDIDTGFSIMLYEHANGQGGKRCFAHTVSDLSYATYDNGNNINNTVSSVQVFANKDCHGQLSYGVADGDMVTVYEHQNFEGQIYGWHDAQSFNFTNWGISSIGIMDGWSALVYEGQNLTGAAECVVSSDLYLSGNNYYNGNPIQDNIRSLQLFNNNNCGGWTPPQPDCGQLVASDVTLFNQQYCKGNSETVAPNAGVQLLLANDAVVSVYVPQNMSVRVYKDIGPNGQSKCLSWSYWDLNADTWDDGTGMAYSITSAEVFDNGSCTIPVPTAPPPSADCGSRTGNKVKLFSSLYCNGTATDSFENNGLYNVTANDSALSVYVPQGKVAIVYKDSNGQGQSKCLAWSYWDLNQDDWPDGSDMQYSVSSVQVADSCP